MAKQWKSVAAAVVIGLAASAGSASAQIGWSLGGGPSFALGELGEEVNMGYHVQGSASLSVPMLPVGIRVDGLFNRHPGDVENYTAYAGSVNAILSVPSLGITPYVIGGIGMYNQKFDDVEDLGHEHESTTDLGFNVGAGVRMGLPGLSIFAEARMHQVKGHADGENHRFVPVTIGIRF